MRKVLKLVLPRNKACWIDEQNKLLTTLCFTVFQSIWL